MSNSDFINSIKDGAIKGQLKYGICASMTMAQATLESGWGKSTPGCNMFGIKWTPDCGYGSQTLPTTEYVNGTAESIYAAFRVYNSLSDSLYDHANFIASNSRYANLIGVKDYKQACQLIQKDGYATDPNYASQLIQIIEQNNLSEYDNIKASTVIEALQYDLNEDYNAKIDVTGFVTNETLTALNGIKSLLVKGHKSHVVQWLQQKLIGWGYLIKGSDDGILGEITLEAIIKLQENWERKPADGTMTLDTWSIFLNN